MPTLLGILLALFPQIAAPKTADFNVVIIGPQFPLAISTTEGFTWASFDPKPNFTYYLAGINRPDAEARGVLVDIPCDGHIVIARFNIINGNTPGSAEFSTVSLLVNDQVGYTLSDFVKNDLIYGNNFRTPPTFDVPIKATDSVEFKWMTPLWTTPPTGVRIKHMVGVRCD